MRRPHAIGAIAVALVWLLTAPCARAAGVTKEQLDQLVKKLEANAELWLKGEPIPASEKADLKEAQFDKGSLPHLEAILKSPRKDTADLYVVNRLLHQLQSADTETIRAALPTLKTLHIRLRNSYRSFPAFSKRQVEALRMPDYDSRLTTEMIMTRMSVLEKTRDTKVEREVPIAKYNEMVFGIERNTYRLMLLADDAREDTALVRTLFLEERNGSAVFILIAEAIADEGKKMSAERAGNLYSLFRPHIGRLATQNKRGYANPGKADLRRDDTSEYDKQEEYAGIKIIETLNRLAEAAKSSSMPKLKAPDKKQIDELHSKKKGK